MGVEIINVEWSIMGGPHPNKYAAAAKDTDDGSRVGIRISLGDKYFWLNRTREPEKAIKIANTLYDLLTEQIIGNPDYVWDSTRSYPFQGDRAPKKGVAKPREERERVGLEYLVPFLWGDATRKPEVKPVSKLGKRKRPLADIDQGRAPREEPKEEGDEEIDDEEEEEE